MVADSSSLGVTAAGGAATRLLSAYNAVFPTASTATPIGGLAEDSTGLSVFGQLTPNVYKNVYAFNFEQGSKVKLGFTNQTNTTDLRIQIYDVTSRLVADSGGTAAQQAAFEDLNSSDGLSLATGKYYVQVTYADGATRKDQNYNFQLYSGTTYQDNIVTTTQIQSYDPNLFVTASASVVPSSNLQLYTQTSVLSSKPSADNALYVGNVAAGETELDVLSGLTATNRAEYFSFNFQSGNTIKLAFNNTTNALAAVPLRVQLLDKTGHTVLADSGGTDAQKLAYQKLTSGAGLGAANGQYLVKVSVQEGYAAGTLQSYDFQLFSGSAYGSIYKTTAQLPNANRVNSTVGTSLNVFADYEAQLYSRQAYHTIGEKASDAVNIGWVSENKSALNAVSQLTSANSAQYYGFTLQQGSALKLAFANTTNTTGVRVQLLDISGTHVIADNEGTDAQKTAFTRLTSASGLQSKTGEYRVKVSYGQNADHAKTQNYNFQIYSGERYTSLYKTIASAQTYQNALLSGNTNVAGYSPQAAAVSYLDSLSKGTETDIFQTISGSLI